MTSEFIELLGDNFAEFRRLMADGFRALQKHSAKILVLTEMMLMGHKDLKCFEGGEETIRQMKRNLFPDGRILRKEEAQAFVDHLIEESVDNWRTLWYDRVQYCCQGIV